MFEILFALAPIFLLILIGHGIKLKAYISDGFWEPAELLTYYVFFPALLLYTTARADMNGLQVMPMAGALIAATVLVAALCIKSKFLLSMKGPEFTSLFQGVIRPNTYVGIGAAFALWGEPGLTLVAVCVAFIVPLVNFLSVIVMETYGGEAQETRPSQRFSPLAKAILKNPLILACLLGSTLNMSGLSLPPVIDPLLQVLGRAALPIGLLCVGAGLNLEAVKNARLSVILSSLTKLLILPGLTAVCCLAFGVEGLSMDVAVLYAGLPVSASSYVLARKMGGDAPVMAGIITLTTLGAMLSLPLLLQLLKMI